VRSSLVFALIRLLTFAFISLVGEAYLRWHHFGLPTDERHLPHPYLQNILNPSVEIVPGERLGAYGLRKTGRDHHEEHQHASVASSIRLVVTDQALNSLFDVSMVAFGIDRGVFGKRPSTACRTRNSRVPPRHFRPF